jgi:hypothetical protein
MNRKEIDAFYLSRFIDSLELDIDKWEVTSCSGWDGSSWSEFHGPEYTNSEGKRLKFAFTLCSTGAYIDGYMSWTIPCLNPFLSTHRRFVTASRKMKKLARSKAEEKYSQKLLESL